MPVAPPGPRSIVADLDVSETSLKARPERLVPRSTALTVVSVLVLAVAGGGGYWAWRAQQQVEPEIEAPVEVAPPPAEPPEEPPIFEEPPPMGPELPPPPATDTKTGKGGKTESTKTGGDAGGKSSKSGSGSKSDSSGKTGNKDGATKGSTGGGSKKSDPVEGGADPYAKRKEKAEGADPGRVLVELEYLSAIDKALKARNWAQALAYIDQHDRELPGGQLVDKFDERRIRAMCGMGRVAEAKTKAQQILTKRPNSLVKNALAEACK